MSIRRGVRPPSAIRRAVAQLVREIGVAATASRLGVGKDSVLRLQTGECVLAATLSVAENNLTHNAVGG